MAAQTNHARYYTILERIAHHRPLCGNKRIISFYKINQSGLLTQNIVVDPAKNSLIAARHYVRNMIRDGWKIE